MAVTGLTYLIVTSRFGLRLMTIREDEVAAEAMGINTFRYKIYAFLLSAAAPGIVGGLASALFRVGHLLFGLASALSVIVLGDESGYTTGDMTKCDTFGGSI